MTDAARAREIEIALDSEDAEERRQATSRIAELAPEDAVRLLIRALGDADWRVRKEATMAARPIAARPSVLDALTTALGAGDNVGLRNAAVEVLANAGAPATAAVAEKYGVLDADGRKLAVEALGRSRVPSALPPLERALADTDDNVREAAIEAIAQLGALKRERVEAFLLSSLDDRDPFVVLTALDGLTSLGVSVPWARIARFLDDPTLHTTAVAAAALTGSPEAATALARCLSRAKGSAFAHAMRSLGRLADGPLAPRVAEALRSEGEELAERLVWTSAQRSAPISDRAVALRLASLARAKGAVFAAIDALGEQRLEDAAFTALRAFGAGAIPDLLSKLEDASLEGGIRAALVEASASFDAPPAELLVAMRSLVRDPDQHVAHAALSAVARLGTATDIPIAAVQALSDSTSIARAAEDALTALAARYPAEARAQAEDMAEQEAFFLPAAVLLAATGRDEARVEQDMAFLAHAATAGDTNARRAAVEAVAEIDGPTAVEILSFALADEEHDVRVAAARGLGKLASAAHESRSLLAVVEGTGASELVAAAVRALGEGIGARGSSRPPPSSAGLFATLEAYARGAASPVAMAAVDALGLVLRRGEPAASALAAAIDHPDEAVVRAAIFKLGATSDGRKLLRRYLDHDSAEVRALAAEMLDGTGERSR